MPEGKLEYSLGLETTNFLGKIVGANQALELFKKAFDSLGTIGEHAMEQIAHGRALRDMSARTGESVKNLFELEKAFKSAGVSPDSVALTLFRFQKSLSGVGEMGESTAEAFKALGLSIGDLSRSNSPEALLKVFEGINKLDRNSATGVAATIFGRGAAGDVLQLARNSKEFADGLEQAAHKAEIFQRNAEIFTQLSRNIERTKNTFKGLWLDVAEGIAPALNGIFASLANKDVPMFAKVLELSLTVAFEKSVNFLANALTKLFAALPNLIKGMVQASAAAVGTPMVAAFANFMARGSEQPDFRPGRTAETDRQRALDAAGWRMLAAGAPDAAADLAHAAAENFTKAFQAAIKAQGPDLFAGGHNAELLAVLAQAGLLPGPRPVPGITGLGPVTAPASGKGALGLLEPNQLERIGALFGGGTSSALTEHARRTATNTSNTTNQLYKVNATLERMERQAAGGLLNA